MSLVWGSSMMRFVFLVEGAGALQATQSVLVFRAGDWSDARTRALDLGLAMEATYTNGAGEEVRFRLEAVETLDLLGDTITDGREVYSEPFQIPPALCSRSRRSSTPPTLPRDTRVSSGALADGVVQDPEASRRGCPGAWVVHGVQPQQPGRHHVHRARRRYGRPGPRPLSSTTPQQACTSPVRTGGQGTWLR